MEFQPNNTKDNSGDDKNLDHITYLKTHGRLFESNPTPTGGSALQLITKLINYPVRDKVWPLSTVWMRRSSMDFIISDERSQLYYCSILEDKYKLLRLASDTKISTVGFVDCSPNQAVVGYENGRIMILDLNTRDIIG